MSQRDQLEWTSGSGTFVVYDYTQEFENIALAIDNLTQAIRDLTSDLDNKMLGATAATVTGSVAHSSAKTLSALRASAGMDIDGNKKQGEGLAALGVIAKQLSGIASTINTGVAIQTLTSMDQIQKNTFDKEATQAALRRNKIPEVTVTQANFLSQVQSNITAGTNLYAQASTVALVNSTASRALTGAANYAFDLLPSFDEITTNFKTLFKSKAADPEGEAARNEAKLLKT